MKSNNGLRSALRHLSMNIGLGLAFALILAVLAPLFSANGSVRTDVAQAPARVVIEDNSVQPAASSAKTYTVKRDQTYGAIAAEHGGCGWNAWHEANGTDPHKLQIGQVLKVPACAGTANAPKTDDHPAAAKAATVKTAFGHVPGAPSAAQFEEVSLCESRAHGHWRANTGNSFYGGLQFTLSSWKWVGGEGYPHKASKEEQIHRAQKLWLKQGWNAWPGCARKLGLPLRK